MARKRSCSGALRERADRRRLREAGHAFEQRMPIREQAGEQPLDEVSLPDDGTGDFRYAVDGRVHRRDLLLEVFEFGGHGKVESAD